MTDWRAEKEISAFNGRKGRTPALPEKGKANPLGGRKRGMRRGREGGETQRVQPGLGKKANKPAPENANNWKKTSQRPEPS